MRRGLVAIILILSTGGLIRAEDHVALNESGNQAFNKGNFEEALDFYRQAEMARPETPEINYNEANALIQTGKFENAAEKYEKALNSDNIQLQADAYYNGGNGFFKQENYQKAIEWYQKALELNPEDMDAKYNLELARNRLREQMKREPQDQQQQQQQQQDQQQDQQQQEQQQQEQQQDQQQQQQQQQDQQQGDEQAQPQGEESEEEQQQQMQPQPENSEDMSKEDALRILNALKDSDQDNQQKQKRFKIQGKYRGKDW